MEQPNQLTPLLTALAGLYAAENRAGGDQAARELLRAASVKRKLPNAQSPALAEALHETLAGNPHPLSPLIRSTNPWIAWGGCDLGHRIKSEIAQEMMLVELVGPDGMFSSDTVRVGLWLQNSGVDYSLRNHSAEETFVILGGSAIWQTSETDPITKGCGAMIHHPSNILHADRTTNTPLLAAWRWSGELSFELYALKG
ncbi:MAG: hypothetical protein ACI861_001715 [Paracoccaceae bacterium]|jgi:hypothetical protein